MMQLNPYDEKDPRYHTANIRRMLVDIREHVRQDVSWVEEDKAQALFEVTAEVLEGLIMAYDHYERGTEEAWQE